MWYENNYRRIFLDMHINDDKQIYLSKFDPARIVALAKQAGAQMLVVKNRSHTGLAHHPTQFGRTHKALTEKDYVKEMIALCHQENLAVEGYFSQIFDNWVYDHYPEWRMVNIEGKTSMEYCDYHNYSMFRRGRYGLICPNNNEYRAYVRNCLMEIAENYPVETIFLDMPFWPEVCYCKSCRSKYFAQTGKELPTEIDWSSEDFIHFQQLREEWMSEFVHLSTKAIKDVNPCITVEHNMSNTSAPWQFGTTDLVADACDYVGGDLYGGFLEQTFICKYFRNLSKVLPFVFITSRCDPGLSAHTTAKTEEELLLHIVTALVHNGAFAVCDGVNPDGTMIEEAYTGIVKQAFLKSKPFEQYVSGNMLKDVAILFPDRSKYDWKESGKRIADVVPFHDTYTNDFSKNPLNLAKILREENIPFDVYPAGKLDQVADQVLAICDVVHIRDDEMEKIERFVANGGSLYLSGRPGHKRLLELLGAEMVGNTQHQVTYMRPTQMGTQLFDGFTEKTPLNVGASQVLMRFSGEYKELAKLTLPYTMTGTQDFASIHSNPPGEDTDFSCAVIKTVGRGRILWLAAPIESMAPYFTRRVVGRLIKELCGELKFTSNAPGFVEVLGWTKDGETYFSVINQQEASPVAPMYDIEIYLPYPIQSAQLMETDDQVTWTSAEGKTTIKLPKLEIFQIIKIAK